MKLFWYNILLISYVYVKREKERELESYSNTHLIPNFEKMKKSNDYRKFTWENTEIRIRISTELPTQKSQVNSGLKTCSAQGFLNYTFYYSFVWYIIPALLLPFVNLSINSAEHILLPATLCECIATNKETWFPHRKWTQSKTDYG